MREARTALRLFSPCGAGEDYLLCFPEILSERPMTGFPNDERREWADDEPSG